MCYADRKIIVFGKNNNIHLIFLILFALILRLAVSMYLISYHPERLIQDDYPKYANALLSGRLNTPAFGDFDRRLFPTYPILIALVTPIFTSSLYSGVAISIFLSLVALFLASKIFKDKLLVFLMAVSPPVWIEQSTKVANEPLFIALALGAVLFFFRKRFVPAGILIGIAFTNRPIALTLLASVLIFLLKKKQFKQTGKILAGFILPVFLLLVFNFSMFGNRELLEQFTHPDRYGQLRFGFLQIVQDFYRTLDWKQYTIFISGTFYVVTNLFAFIVLWINKKKSHLIYFCFLWQATTLLFVFTFSPFTLLDNFGRYALAALPAYLYGFSLFYQSLWRLFISQNRLHKKGGK